MCYILNHMVQYARTGFDASFAALSDVTRRGVLEQLGVCRRFDHGPCQKFHMTLTGMKKHVPASWSRQGWASPQRKMDASRTCETRPAAPAGGRKRRWIEKVTAKLWDARFDELDKVVEELKRKEKVDGRKKRK